MEPGEGLRMLLVQHSCAAAPFCMASAEKPQPGEEETYSFPSLCAKKSSCGHGALTGAGGGMFVSVRDLQCLAGATQPSISL